VRGVSAVPSVQVGSGLLSIRYGPDWPVGSSQVDRVLTTIPDRSKTAVVISALLFTHLLELLDPGVMCAGSNPAEGADGPVRRHR
jgi:hypothetical protein